MSNTCQTCLMLRMLRMLKGQCLLSRTFVALFLCAKCAELLEFNSKVLVRHLRIAFGLGSVWFKIRSNKFVQRHAKDSLNFCVQIMSDHDCQMFQEMVCASSNMFGQLSKYTCPEALKDFNAKQTCCAFDIDCAVFERCGRFLGFSMFFILCIETLVLWLVCLELRRRCLQPSRCGH